MNFVDKEGKTVSVKGHVGENILDVAHANNIDLEGWGCGTHLFAWNSDTYVCVCFLLFLLPMIVGRIFHIVPVMVSRSVISLTL